MSKMSKTLIRVLGAPTPSHKDACSMSVNPQDVSTLTEHGAWTLAKMRNRDSFYIKGEHKEVEKILNGCTPSPSGITLPKRFVKMLLQDFVVNRGGNKPLDKIRRQLDACMQAAKVPSDVAFKLLDMIETETDG